MKFNDKQFKEWQLQNQFRIPRKQEFRAHMYGQELTYNEVTILYEIAVREVLMFHNVKVLSEIPWGKGYMEAAQRWVDKMSECISTRKHDQELKEKKYEDYECSETFF